MKTRLIALFTICLMFIMLTVTSVQGKSNFPIDMDPDDTSLGITWQVSNVIDWMYFLMDYGLLNANDFDWRILAEQGMNAFAFHDFLASGRLFSRAEVLDAFKLYQFDFWTEWPKSDIEWETVFHREITPAEIGTVCARLTRTLAAKQRKSLSLIDSSEKKWLDRRGSSVVSVALNSAAVIGKINATVTIASELFVEGGRYIVYTSNNQRECFAREGVLIFQMNEKTEWIEVASRSTETAARLSSLKGHHKMDVTITIEGSAEFFGNTVAISETAVISHTIMPKLTVRELGDGLYAYESEDPLDIIGVSILIHQPAVSLTSLGGHLENNGDGSDVKLQPNNPDELWYYSPYPSASPLMPIYIGAGTFTLTLTPSASVEYVSMTTYYPLQYEYLSQKDTSQP